MEQGAQVQVKEKGNGLKEKETAFWGTVKCEVKSSQVKSSRLPYGCLLFMYRLDLKCELYTGGSRDTHETHTGHAGELYR
jgi:hypothetical protein